MSKPDWDAIYAEAERQSGGKLEPGKTYWVPSRMFHPVYRKGDGLIAWLKSKYWDWMDGR